MNDPRIEAAAEEARKIAMEEEGIHVSPWRLSVAQEAYRKDARRILAAVDKAATITTFTGVDSLPDGSVVIDSGGDVSQRRGDWWCSYETAPMTSRQLAKYLPARVLYWGNE